MQLENRSTGRARRVLCVLAAGITLSLVPSGGATPALQAVAPATKVTGLARGARGDAVRQVQQALVNQGIAVEGGVDGIFGAGTEAALKQFQTKKGLPATGVVDDATALSLGLASSNIVGLTQGNSGPAVKELQQALLAHGVGIPGGADGVFGPATRDGVRVFQSAKGLKVTGVVDASTAAALGKVSTGGGAQPAAPANPPANPPARPAAAASSLVGLKIGSNGNGVKVLQQQLMALGFNVVGGADGVFGVLTANALSSFQSSVGLTANAIVNEATAAKLAESGAAAPSAPVSLLGLKIGNQGTAVRQLQQALINAGVNVKGGADGVFGPGTQAAVKQYQSGVGIGQTGVVDDATAAALAGGQKPASVPTASSPMLGLKAGSLGASVKQLQQALITAGVSVRGGADGIFGPATAQALKAFQTAQGLGATGVVDDATIAALAKPKPPAPATGATTGFAAYGERGNRVMALQSALIKAGIPVRGGVDGDFGSATSAAVMEYQRRNGLSVTGKVDAATAAALGLSAAAAPAAPDPSGVTMAAFPVQGRCSFADTWQYDRSGGRSHLGVDIIAARGRLIYAVNDGTITKTYADFPGSLAGNGVRLSTADGTYFFYAHMDSLAPGIQVGTRVKAGQVLGYLGSTGNAGTSHLHFEVHPKGGSAVNPYPIIKPIDACKVTEPLAQP